jgi:hypothetical protein
MMEKSKFERRQPAFESLFSKRKETYEKRNAEKVSKRNQLEPEARSQNYTTLHPQRPVSCGLSTELGVESGQ